MQLLALCIKRNVRTILLFFVSLKFLLFNEIEIEGADNRLRLLFVLCSNVFFIWNEIICFLAVERNQFVVNL